MQVIKGLKAAEKVFGCTTNGKGFKVLQHSAVIQGDGINYDTLRKIQTAVLAEGYSAENVAYGMGGALLPKLNRDTMSFATKVHFLAPFSRVPCAPQAALICPSADVLCTCTCVWYALMIS